MATLRECQEHYDNMDEDYYDEDDCPDDDWDDYPDDVDCDDESAWNNAP